MTTSVARAPRTEIRSIASWIFLLLAGVVNYLITRTGIQTGGVELNAVGTAIVEYVGASGLVLALKLPAIAFVAVMWVLLPVQYRDISVLVVALVWSLTAAWNTLAVMGAV